MTKSRNYWKDRLSREEKKAKLSEEEATKRMQRMYQKTFREIEKDIMVLFQRYAKDNDLTRAEALKYLTDSEFSEWRMDLKEYMREIKHTGNPQLKMELETLAMKSRISRLEELQYHVNKDINNLFDYNYKTVKTLLEKSVTNAYKGSGLADRVPSKAKKKLEKILVQPWSGNNYSGRIWENRNTLARVAREEIEKGMFQGKGVKSMTKDIANRMDGSFKNIERVVRTESVYARNEAQAQAYEDFDYEYYEFSSHTEGRSSERTCANCNSLDGKIYKFKDRIVGVNFPPLHPNCRCTVIPMLREDVEGFENKNYNENKKKEPKEPKKEEPKTIEFVEAKNRKEAEKFARENLGIKNISYKGCDIESVNAWNRGLTRSVNKFPKLKDNFGFVGECHERNEIIKEEIFKELTRLNPGKSEDIIKDQAKKTWRRFSKNFSVSTHTFAQSFSPGKESLFYPARGVTVNKVFAKNSGYFKECLIRDVESKHHPIGGDTIESILDHEIGHQLDDMLGIGKIKEVQDLYNSRTRDEITNDLSRYAWDNRNPNRYSEMIAEAYAEYCNNPNPREIAKTIGEIIEREYKKKFGK